MARSRIEPVVASSPSKSEATEPRQVKFKVMLYSSKVFEWAETLQLTVQFSLILWMHFLALDLKGVFIRRNKIGISPKIFFCLSSVWPDFSKIHYLGKILWYLAIDLVVYLAFVKKLGQLLQVFCAIIGHIFIFLYAHTSNQKYNHLVTLPVIEEDLYFAAIVSLGLKRCETSFC